MCYSTIAIPVKDGEAWLRQTLDEVDDFIQKCTFSCEIIAVDDGGCGRTPDILEEYRMKNSYVKVLTHKQNQGKGAALRSAVAASSGEFVLTLDADASYSVEQTPFLLEKLRE